MNSYRPSYKIRKQLKEFKEALPKLFLDYRHAIDIYYDDDFAAKLQAKSWNAHIEELEKEIEESIQHEKTLTVYIVKDFMDTGKIVSAPLQYTDHHGSEITYLETVFRWWYDESDDQTETKIVWMTAFGYEWFFDLDEAVAHCNKEIEKEVTFLTKKIEKYSNLKITNKQEILVAAPTNQD